MLHPNPTYLDTVEGQKTKKFEKIKGLDYTAAVIVDFLLFKAKLYNFRPKIFYFIGLLRPRRPRKALIKTSFFGFLHLSL